jgi:hypothetical protein
VTAGEQKGKDAKGANPGEGDSTLNMPEQPEDDDEDDDGRDTTAAPLPGGDSSQASAQRTFHLISPCDNFVRWLYSSGTFRKQPVQFSHRSTRFRGHVPSTARSMPQIVPRVFCAQNQKD